jgi:hypothetical protein
MRLLSLDLGGRQIRNGLAQQYFNGAQLGHGEANLTEGALVKPIDKLTGSDFFPDVIGMKEHFSFCHLFRLLHAYSTGCRFQVGVSMADDSKQAAASIGRNGFIWLLALAAGTYFLARQVPLEATRPPASEKFLPEHHGAQNVSARLWQDPFGAVAEALARPPTLIPENCPAKNSHQPTTEQKNSSPIANRR